VRILVVWCVNFFEMKQPVYPWPLSASFMLQLESEVRFSFSSFLFLLEISISDVDTMNYSLFDVWGESRRCFPIGCLEHRKARIVAGKINPTFKLFPYAGTTTPGPWRHTVERDMVLDIGETGE
jgi:hypothetical protein